MFDTTEPSQQKRVVSSPTSPTTVTTTSIPGPNSQPVTPASKTENSNPQMAGQIQNQAGLTATASAAPLVAPLAGNDSKYNYTKLSSHIAKAVNKEGTEPLIGRFIEVIRAMQEVYKWNVENGGSVNSWDKESRVGLKRNLVKQLTIISHKNLGEFASSVGVKLELSPPELKPRSYFKRLVLVRPVSPPNTTISPSQAASTLTAAQSGTVPTEEAISTASQPEPARQVSRKEAEQIALTTVASVKDRRGNRLRGGGTIAGNHRAIEFIKLLRRAGGLSLDQLRFLASFNRPNGPAAGHEVQDTIKLLKSVSVPFVEVVEQRGWNGSPVNIHLLSQAGETYYNSLPDVDTKAEARRQTGQNQRSNLAHLYGTYQSLASIAGACTRASAQLQGENDLAHVNLDIDDTPLLRMEWSPSPGYAYPRSNAILGASSSSSKRGGKDAQRQLVRPDAAGRIILEHSALRLSLMQQAGIPAPQDARAYTETRYRYVSSSNQSGSSWNFLLEYDTGSESIPAFGEKALAYTQLLNANQDEWPTHWAGTFPTILVVTAGGSTRMLNMLMEVSRQLKKVEKRTSHYPQTHGRKIELADSWWFTCTAWFKLAYQDYIGSFNRSKVTRRQLAGRIWLPLSSVCNNTEIQKMGSTQKSSAIRALNKSLVSRQSGSLDSVFADQLVAIPVPHH